MSEMICECEFDAYPGMTGKVQLRRNDRVDSVFVVVGDEESSILISDRDQWGVWHQLSGFTVAQEDGTRSMIDGMIRCLEMLKEMTECDTKPATVSESE